VALDPTFAPVHAILAKALAAAGQCAEAEQEYAAALEIDANDPTAGEPHGHCVATR
jgi:Flp pilus assembly protein TadD